MTMIAAHHTAPAPNGDHHHIDVPGWDSDGSIGMARLEHSEEASSSSTT
jgi:hypothetical protein